MIKSDERLALTLLIALGAIYLIGLVLGWAELAPWHLLLVLVAIVGLYWVFVRRTRVG